MTEIDVHFNAPDKVHHACRLLRKAVVTAGAKVAVAGDKATLDILDASLWQFSATDFIAHCRGDAEEEVLVRSPVVLLDAPSQGAQAHRQVLVNLGCDLPVGFERFERLIDVVGTEQAERQSGRQRWRHYAERGYAITRHDVGGRR
ncbi:DNA polymerase III subunit chi [Xenophilus aerolatus]|nr:DNA polymerase III subunit chi [Xenophilus aerolatus]